MESRERPVLYVCDPAKNTGCRKRGCVYNQDALVKTCAKMRGEADFKLGEMRLIKKKFGKTMDYLFDMEPEAQMA